MGTLLMNLEPFGTVLATLFELETLEACSVLLTALGFKIKFGNTLEEDVENCLLEATAAG